MSTDLQVREFDHSQLDLIKRTVAKGATNDEFALFLHACKRTGLDPLMKQIYAIKRWSAVDQRETMAIQTGIDGYRLTADRTGKYMGNDEPIFDGSGLDHPLKATVTVWKLVEGQRCAFTASARWEEYVQKKNGEPTSFWKRMPYGQLAKCAEALALRKAFPAELSGVYTHEEMQQADNEERNPIMEIPHVRPRVGDRDLSPSRSEDLYPKSSRQEDGADIEGRSPANQLGAVAPSTQQASDAPAHLPESASEFAKRKAREANDLFIDGFIVNLEPYSGIKRNEKGKRPGQFHLDDGMDKIILGPIKYFDPALDISSGLKRVFYKESLFNGKTQYECLKIESLETT